MLDTGAEKTFVDSAIALALGIDLSSCAQLPVVGLSGPAKPTPAMELDVLVLHGPNTPSVTLQVGFVENLAMTVGNLLGRDFFTFFDLGLSHSVRTAYIGRAR
jgi:predicted aspartyl protease